MVVLIYEAISKARKSLVEEAVGFKYSAQVVEAEEMLTAWLMVGAMCRVATGVVVPIPMLPAWVMRNTEVPEEEAMLKMSEEPALPCRLKVMVEEVALMPATVPLSLIKPWAKVLTPFQIETKPVAADAIELR